VGAGKGCRRTQRALRIRVVEQSELAACSEQTSQLGGSSFVVGHGDARAGEVMEDIVSRRSSPSNAKRGKKRHCSLSAIELTIVRALVRASGSIF